MSKSNKLHVVVALSRQGQMVGQGTRGRWTYETESDDRQLCGGVVQLVRTPACHAGGRELESRRSRQFGDDSISKVCSIPLQLCAHVPQLQGDAGS
jgi:hypothetical protein